MTTGTLLTRPHPTTKRLGLLFGQLDNHMNHMNPKSSNIMAIKAGSRYEFLSISKVKLHIPFPTSDITLKKKTVEPFLVTAT